MKYPRFIPSILLSLALTGMALANEVQPPVNPAPAEATSPWAFNLSAYMWLAGVTGNLSAGPFSRSVDTSFIDINSQSRRFPLGFMGRAEASVDRFGFYLDGNYMDLQLKPKLNSLSNGLDSTLGLMDYGFSTGYSDRLHQKCRPSRSRNGSTGWMSTSEPAHSGLAIQSNGSVPAASWNAAHRAARRLPVQSSAAA